MRRILIFIHSFEPFSDSNTNALLPLLPLLTQDYEVDVFCANKNNKMKWRDRSHGCTVLRYATLGKFENRLLGYSLKEISKVRLGRPRVLLRACLRNARIRGAKVFARVYPHWDYAKLKRLVTSGDYAAIVTVTSPIGPQFVTLRLKREGLLERSGTAWVPWFMDPYSTYIGHSSVRDSLVMKEREIYEAARLVIVTPELNRDNDANEFTQYRHKTRVLPLANLRVEEQSEEATARESETVNFLYAGSLQDVSVRNPMPLFRLIAKSPCNFIFHMMITTWCHETEELRDRYLSDCDQVRWHDPMPLQESLLFIKKMDVLINIGNEAGNQLPGKCYDLVGTGQPILNVFTRDDDTSEQFLMRYPLHLGLQFKNSLPGDDLLEEQIGGLVTFVIASQGRRVPADTTRRLYREFLPESVYARFKHILEEAVL